MVSSRLAAARRFIKGFNLHAYPAGAYFCMCASSRAALNVGSLSPWDRQPSNAPPLLLSPAGLASRRGPHTKTHLGLCPKTPLPLNCGWIRTMRSIVRTAPQIRSQGACGAFYFGTSRNQIKNQPYKRRLIPLREAALWLSGRGKWGPARSQDLVGKGGCTAAGRAARSKAQGQPDLSEGCVRRDDAYKVDF